MEDSIKKVQKINKLRDELEELNSQTRTGFHKIGESGFQKWDYFHRKSALIVKSIFGENSQYSRDWLSIEIPEDPDIEDDKGLSTYLRKQGIAEDKMENQLEIMAKELVLFKPQEKEKKEASIEIPSSKPRSNRIFIVHGKDDGMKQSVTRTVEKLGLEPVILHEKANEGRTLIEKFTDYTDVQFAIVLLSPDDFGCLREEGIGKGKFRARQNVILELGFFLGKLGRKYVLPIYKESENFEMPSDYNGVVYTPFDSNEQWKLKLVKELKARKYEVDANKIL